MGEKEADQMRELCLDSHQNLLQLLYSRYFKVESELETAMTLLKDRKSQNPTEEFSLDPSPVLHRLKQNVQDIEQRRVTVWSELASFTTPSFNPDLSKILSQLVEKVTSQEKLFKKVTADVNRVNDSLLFLTRKHLSNSSTPAEIGKQVIARLESDGLITDADIIDDENGFWSDEVQNKVNTFENESDFDVFITPFFDNVLNSFDMVFINSEGLSWLPQSHDKNTLLKPDGFATHRGMYHARKEPNDKIKRPEGYRFGVAVQELLDCVMLFERKLKIDAAAFGQVVRYLQLLNTDNAACAILFDPKSFWLIKSHTGTITKVVKSKWVHKGSQLLFRNFFGDNKSPWIERLSNACKAFDVHVEEGNAFLGRGTYGRVFRVKRENIVYALKIVEPEFAKRLSREENALKKAKNTGLTIKSIDECFFDDGICAALLLSPVGEPLPPPKTQHDVSQFYTMLHKLHQYNMVHGDPRIPNIICFGEKLFWIDLAELADANFVFRKTDFVILTQSILSIPYKYTMDSDVMELITMHARSKTLDTLKLLITKVCELLGL
jgi:tRNA A-37 threonylcarbamoyl transferase component Bud32